MAFTDYLDTILTKEYGETVTTAFVNAAELLQKSWAFHDIDVTTMIDDADLIDIAQNYFEGKKIKKGIYDWLKAFSEGTWYSEPIIITQTQAEYDGVKKHYTDLYGIQNDPYYRTVLLDESFHPTSTMKQFPSEIAAATYIKTDADSRYHIDVPYGATAIESSFSASGDALYSIHIPPTVTSIADSAFEDTGIWEVAIPRSVLSIGEKAFRACPHLNNIDIPKSVKTIGENAFADCEILSTIHVDGPEDSIEGAPWGADDAQVKWNVKLL